MGCPVREITNWFRCALPKHNVFAKLLPRYFVTISFKRQWLPSASSISVVLECEAKQQVNSDSKSSVEYPTCSKFKSETKIFGRLWKWKKEKAIWIKNTRKTNVKKKGLCIKKYCSHIPWKDNLSPHLTLTVIRCKIVWRFAVYKQPLPF